jgi:glycosyltransferase involved in cell wall biosynthesis
MNVLFVTQEPWRAPEYGGQARIHGLISGLVASGLHVDVLAPRVQEETDTLPVGIYESGWLNLPENSYPLSIGSLIFYGIRVLNSLRGLGRTMNYDIIYVQQLYAAWCGFALGIGFANLVLDEHNVEWDLQRQYDLIKPSQWRRLRVYEALCCKLYGHVTIPSASDKSLLCESLGVNPGKVSVVPNGVDCSKFGRMDARGTALKRSLSAEDKHIIFFMGSYGYIPNRDAAQIIINQIYPETRQLVPGTLFMFVGRKPEKLRVPLRKDIMALGVVQNVVDWINAASVCIAPLRFGSGTRLKILEWMACEKPIIATRKAVEGLEVKDGENIILEDDFEKYPGLIRELIANPERSASLGKNARNLVLERYDWCRIGTDLEGVFKNL